MVIGADGKPSWLGALKYITLTFLIIQMLSCSKVTYVNRSSALQLELIDTSAKYVHGDTLAITARITNLDTVEISFPIGGPVFRLVPKPVSTEFIGWHWTYWFIGVGEEKTSGANLFLKLEGKEQKVIDLNFVGEDNGVKQGEHEFLLSYLVYIKIPEEKVNYQVYSRNSIMINIKKKL